MIDYAARVALGVEWLDEVHPGWRDKVDTDRLKMYNTHQCILGQVFGTYWRPVDEMFYDGEDQSGRLGFNIPQQMLNDIHDQYFDEKITADEREDLVNWEYAHLENEWRKALSV